MQAVALHQERKEKAFKNPKKRLQTWKIEKFWQYLLDPLLRFDGAPGFLIFTLRFPALHYEGAIATHTCVP